MENGTDEHSDDDYCHCRIVTGRFGIEDDDGEYGAGKSARAGQPRNNYPVTLHSVTLIFER